LRTAERQGCSWTRALLASAPVACRRAQGSPGDDSEASEDAHWESDEESGHDGGGVRKAGAMEVPNGEEPEPNDGAGVSGSSELERTVASLGSLNVTEGRRKLVALREGTGMCLPGLRCLCKTGD